MLQESSVPRLVGALVPLRCVQAHDREWFEHYGFNYAHAQRRIAKILSASNALIKKAGATEPTRWQNSRAEHFRKKARSATALYERHDSHHPLLTLKVRIRAGL